MCKLLIVILSVAFLMNSKASAMDPLSVMHQRPSYIQLYTACTGDTELFKEEMYINVYQRSIQNTVLVVSLSGKEVAQSVNSHGTTPYLSQFLNQEATSFALGDCFKNEEDHFAFIRNLIIIDSVGKAVGISVATVSYRFLGKVLKNIIIKPLAAISPKIFRKLEQLTVGALISTQVYLNKDEYVKLFSGRDISQEAQDATVNNIIKSSSDSLSDKANAQINKIELALQNQNLTNEQKEYLVSELKKWKIILNEFSS